MLQTGWATIWTAKQGMSQGSRSEDGKNVVMLGRAVGYHDLGVAERRAASCRTSNRSRTHCSNSAALAEHTELIEADDILDPGVQTSSRSVVFLWATANSDEPTEDVKPFLPRFLLQEVTTKHSPHDDLHPNQPVLWGNLLCRADWLRLRGIAGTECAILPIREIAAYPRCRASEHPSTGERPTARRSLPTPEPVSEFCWQPLESQRHNQLERRSDEFDADVVSFQPRFLLQGPSKQPALHISPMHHHLIVEPVSPHKPS